jgi:hypothetical protein
MAKFMPLMDYVPHQPQNPSQQIYEFHVNPRQLLRTNRRIQAAVFAAQT